MSTSVDHPLTNHSPGSYSLSPSRHSLFFWFPLFQILVIKETPPSKETGWGRLAEGLWGVLKLFSGKKTKRLNMSTYIQAVWETDKPVWEPNNYFSGLCFWVLFQQKIVAINDFKMYLIIFKWAWRQKSRQKRKTIRQKEVKARKRNCLWKIFHSFNYVYDFSPT